MEEKQRQRQRPHVLAVPFPAQGHINPMLHLCKRLSSRGISITFLVPQTQKSFIAAEHRVPPGQCFRFAFLPDQETFSVGDSGLQFIQALEANLKVTIPEIIREVMQDESLPSVSCILSDVTLVELQAIAREFGILKVSLSTFSASWHSIQNGLDPLKRNGLLPIKGSSRIIDFIPGLPPLSGQDFPLQVQEADLVADPDFTVRKTRHDMLKNEDVAFINSFQELEASQFNQFPQDGQQFLPIGPLLLPLAFDDSHCDNEQSSGFWKEDLSCLKWLDEQPEKSVLYVSFGSLASASTDQIRELYAGLVRSGYSFLWVVRSDSNHGDIEEILKDDGKRCKFVSWAPQLKVLKHPSVAAFLTHCGWNSILETIVAGVPIIGWPFLYDQPLNCALAAGVWKIGCRLPSPLDMVVVSEAVKDVMEGTTGDLWRSNVLKLSKTAKGAASSGGLSKGNLDAFVCKMWESLAMQA